MTITKLFILIAVAALVLTVLRVLFKKSGNILITYIQNFLGSLFIFSGVVKAIDPLGLSYKMEEYFEAFQQEGFAEVWKMMAEYATPFAVGMIVLELAVGIAILMSWRPKISTVLLFWINIFFTFLTGYTYLSGYGITKLFILAAAAIFGIISVVVLVNSDSKRKKLVLASLGLLGVFVLGVYFSSTQFFTSAFTETKMKVTDCGCFGDFMKLKPWETFYKDIFLTTLSLILVVYRQKVVPILESKLTDGLVLIVTVASLFFCFSNFVWGLPMVDFRPYKIGNDIKEQMKVIKEPKVEMLFTYKNIQTGEVKAFNMNSLPTDTTWEFVDRKDNVLDPGIPAKITNLFVENKDGVNMNDSLLNDPNYSLWVVSYKIENTEEKAWKETVNPLADSLQKNGHKVYAILSGFHEDFEKKMHTNIPFLNADATPLKTMIRSNPGFMLIKNGKVVGLWHWADEPTFEQIKTEMK